MALKLKNFDLLEYIAILSGSEWIAGTCFKSPCVVVGNNELTSVYR